MGNDQYSHATPKKGNHTAKKAIPLKKRAVTNQLKSNSAIASPVTNTLPTMVAR
jgi:hypothetical protein